jgi:hypothetical protein
MDCLSWPFAMNRRFTQFAIVLLGSLSLLVSVSAIAEAKPKPKPRSAAKPSLVKPTLAKPIARESSFVDHPICYAMLPGNISITNLEKLCGLDKKAGNLIDLTIDQDGDGVPDQLLVAMRSFNARMSSAKTPQEYEAALYSLEDRLPYSPSVKQLQGQQRDLQRRLASATGEAQSRELYRQLDEVQQQIYKDPSYSKIQEAMSKVYGKLNR